MITPKEVAEFITDVAENKRTWFKAPGELSIEREIEEYVQLRIKEALTKYKNNNTVGNLVEDFKQYSESILESEEKTAQILKDTGIHTEDGKLSKNYGGE